MIQKLAMIIMLGFSSCTALYAEPEFSVDEDEEIRQAIEAYTERSWELGLAAGYGIRTNPLVNSDDIPMYVVLNIAWFGDYFFFDNGDVGVTVYETDKLSLNLISHINNEREIFEWLNNSQLGVQFFGTANASDFSPPHTTEINAIENIKPIEPPKRSLAIDAGLEIIMADDWGDIQLQVLTDITHTHRGIEVWASYAYPWQTGNWKIVPSFGINWKSRHLLDYYYGVRESETEINRPAYQAHSGFNSFARLAISYRINDHWGITGIAEYESLSRSIRHSPIVDEDGIETLFIGLMYNF